MNNFKYMSNKAARNTLQTGILSQIKSFAPNIENNISKYRYPILPKIVLYSSSATSDSFLKKIFPQYNMIVPTLTDQSDQLLTQRIAKQLIRAGDHNKQDKQLHFINFLKGFPFNTNQAIFLDKYINGVNLAIYLKSPVQNQNYGNLIKPLLNYYDQRGMLLQINEKNQITSGQLEDILFEIRTKIKLSN